MSEIKKEEDSILTLFEKYKKGSIEARDKIIEYYMPRAEEIAVSFYGLGLEKEDVISSAYEGLVKAIDKYKNSNYFLNFMKEIIIDTIKNVIINSLFSSLKLKPPLPLIIKFLLI